MPAFQRAEEAIQGGLQVKARPDAGNVKCRAANHLELAIGREPTQQRPSPGQDRLSRGDSFARHSHVRGVNPPGGHVPERTIDHEREDARQEAPLQPGEP